jgi:SP family arabinose:H+ symporter-like MFS transporter
LQQFVGINAVVMYGTKISEKVLPKLTKVIPVILNLEQVLGCLVTGYLLMRLGRKQILQFGTVTGVISLLMISAGFFIGDNGSALKLIGLIIFMGNFGLSLGPIVWLYIPEILEPSRIAISTMANWASASLVTIMFPIIDHAMGAPTYIFLFFAIYCTIAFFFSQKFVIETKGKT